MNDHKSSHFPIYLLIFSLIASPLFFLPVIHSFILPRKALVEIFLIIIIALFMVEGKEKTKRNILTLPWFLMNATWFVSIFHSPSFLTGWKVFFFFFILSSLALIITSIYGFKKHFNLLLSAILIPGFINAVYIFIQLSGIDFEIMKNSKFMAPGTLGSPGMLGGYFSLCCIISFHLYATTKNKWKTPLFALLTLLFVVVSSITLSRTSLLSIAGGLLTFSVLSLFTKSAARDRPLKSFIAIVFLFVTATVTLLPNTGIFNYATNSDRDINSYFFNRYKSNSVLQRRLIWKSTIEIIKDNPLHGSGAGSFYYEYPPSQAKVLKGRELSGAFPRIAADRVATYAHNDFLQIAAETGFPGLISFLLFPLFSLFHIFKLSSSKDSFAVTYMPVLGSGIVALLIQSLFDFPLYMPATALIFWIFIGASSLESGVEEKTAPIQLPARLFTYIAAGSLIFMVSMPVIAAMNLSYANSQLVNGDLNRASQFLETAVAFDPSEPEIYVELGRMERIRGNFPQSMRYYDKALILSNHPGHFYGKGMAAYLAGNLAEAEMAFSSVLDIDPRSVESLTALSMVMIEIGDKERANALFHNILEIDPSNKSALSYLKAIHESNLH